MNMHWPLDDRMTVALFAGMGGACDGLEEAGFPVHLAINHDPVAIAVHSHRHPHTKHLRCDVFEVDPREACAGRQVRMLWGSPDCTDFSVAKGSKPVSKRRRSLAWVICRWAGSVMPETIGLENVYEITGWGPLIAKRCKETGRVLKLDGSVAAKGERVRVQDQQLVRDPRHKGRIWKAWCKHLEGLGYRFEFKKLCCADYGVATIRTRLFGIATRDRRPIVWPERTHAPRSKAKALGLKPWVGMHTCIDWSLPMKSIFGRKKDLAPATQRRIARGVMKYVINAQSPFIVPICQTGGTTAGRSVDEPGYTQTTAKGGELMLVSPHLTKFRTGATGNSLDDALPTYTANSHHKRSGCAPPMGIVAATLIQAGNGEKMNETPRCHDVKEPVRTQTAGGQRQAVIAATMVRQFGKSGAADIVEPNGTITAGGGGKTALVAAFLAQHNDGPRAGANVKPVTEPTSTLTTTGSQQGIIAAAMTSLRGSKRGGSDIREPMPAQSSGGNHEMLILPFLQAYYSSGGQHQDVKDPLLAVTSKDRHGLVCVEVDGETFVITDIMMRMLDPMEGARAHGFDPKSFPENIVIDGVEKRLTKTAKGHLVGNSVPKELPRLLAELNIPNALEMVAAE